MRNLYELLAFEVVYVYFCSGVGCVEEDNMAYMHNTIKILNGVTTKLECGQTCANHPECEFWSYWAGEARCFLKTSDSGRTPIDWFVSGNKKCGN